MRFCPSCGTATERRIPPDDDRERDVCPGCDAVHYHNPKVVVGCIVEDGEDRVLLCRRAIPPGHGLWTFPAGYLEVGESAVEGAVRETREEACCEVEVLGPHAHLDLVHIGQIYAVWRARLIGEYAAGVESLEVASFELDAVPWDEIAFPSIRCALELWREDRSAGARRLHHGVLRYDGSGDRLALSSYELRERSSMSLGPAGGEA